MSPSTTFVLSLCLLPLPLFAQSNPGEAPAPPPAPPPAAQSAPEEATRELEARREELALVTKEIGAIQSQAEAAPEVQTIRNKYRDILQTEMVKSAPALKDDIERQAELVNELTASAPGDEKSDEVTAEKQQLMSEYRALHEKLTPVEEGVRDVPAVQTTRKEYYDKLVAEMQRIEPRTDELLAKHRELVAVVRELSAQAQTG